MVSIELFKALVRVADNPDIFFNRSEAPNSGHLLRPCAERRQNLSKDGLVIEEV